MNTTEKWNEAISKVGCPEHNQKVIDAVNQRENLNLRLLKDYDGNIYASDHLNWRYIIIGTWVQGRFTVRGIVRKKTRKQKGPMCYLSNGQASSGTKQIAYYPSEEFVVEVPEVVEAFEKFNKKLY